MNIFFTFIIRDHKYSLKKKKFLKLKNTGLFDNAIINAIIDSYVMSEDSHEKSGISDYYQKKLQL